MSEIYNKLSTILMRAHQGGSRKYKVGGNLEGTDPHMVIANTDMIIQPTKTYSTIEPAIEPAIGGAKVKTYKGAYKKYLNKFTLDILQKEAKKKGIKITTKKNGKTSYIKKASLINKIAIKKFSKS